MKSFAHFNSSSVEEAVALLKRYKGKANLIAGGTDLLGQMKDRTLPNYPEALINLKSIPGIDQIQKGDDDLTIGPLALLEDIAHNPIVKENCPALAEAARKTASPHIREMGTIGGNICQDIRCWYYRHPDNRFPCLRKGGGKCYAWDGDNRYHSIFGASVEDGCIAVHPGDMAPALLAFNAKIRTSKRTIAADDFFIVDNQKTTCLEDDEIVTAIKVPLPGKAAKSAFIKFALRTSIDFPIVNCAAVLETSNKKVTSARICLNAVFVRPYRAFKTEEMLIGKTISEKTALAAAEATVEDVKPLSNNNYMIDITKIMLKRTILACK
jgi:xanthine dehydrogenase YagS FAD-binding subunit